MSSIERHSRLVRLFEEACRLVGEERDALVDGASQDDPEVGRDLLALLEQDSQADGPTDQISSQRHGSSSSELLVRLTEHAPAKSRYRVIEKVDKGGQGAILKVWDEDLRRSLAMKVVLGTSEEPIGTESPPVDDRVLSRFLQEAQVTGQLEHPGVVPVHELGVDSRGNVYFTMRLVRGRNFQKVIRAIHDPADEEWTLTRGVDCLLRFCEALAYAHSKGVIHRDLKPANLMVGKYGECYVMDWGLARVTGEDDEIDVRVAEEPDASVQIYADRTQEPASGVLRTQSGDVFGTADYMPPEQARGDIDLMGPRSDVYSLGAVLYELLADKKPYSIPGARVDPHDVLRWVKEGPPRALGSLDLSVPEELVSICERAMSRDPLERYESVGELGRDLRAFLDTRVVRAHRTGPVIEFQKWVRRNRSTAISLAALVLVLVMAGFGAALFQSRARVADLRRLQERTAELCVASAGDLYPVHPDRVPGLESWLGQARSVVGLLPEVENELSAFEARHADAAREPDEAAEARRPSSFEVTSLETKLSYLSGFKSLLEGPRTDGEPISDAEANELRFAEDNLAVLKLEIPRIERELAAVRAARADGPAWRYVDAALREEHESLRAFHDDLERLAGPNGGLIPEVEQRHEAARTLAARSLDEAAPEWKRAIAAISDPSRSPLYGGLSITPQLGLVPLGPDPSSGLWEFWCVLSGERPERGPDGRWRILPETGLVLVLVPGGTQSLGAQVDDPKAPNFVAPEPGVFSGLRPNEDWTAEVELSPYFLSKYELTQGQWMRLTGTQPSEYWAGASYLGMPRFSLTHPVESVSWYGFREALARWSLELPTEAQWERAARAGRDRTYTSGETIETLFGQANFADVSGSRGGIRGTDEGGRDDEYAVHAPVDALDPNPWGFHHISGNVAEWCSDWFADICERGSYLPGTGEHRPVYARKKPIRGGSYHSDPELLRVSVRFGSMPNVPSEDSGVRPARPLVQPDPVSVAPDR